MTEKLAERLPTLVFKGPNKISLRECRDILEDPRCGAATDFDHTAFDTSSFHRDSFTLAVGQQLGKVIKLEREYILQKLRGQSGPTVVTRLHEDYGNGATPKIIAEALAMRGQVLADMVTADADLSSYFMPGVPNFIRHLRRVNRSLGISTQSPDAFVNRFLEGAKVDDHPVTDVLPTYAVVGETSLERYQQDLTCDCTKPPVVCKPNPFTIRLAARMAGANFDSRIFYSGDSEVDGKSVCGREEFVGVIVNDTNKASNLDDEFREYRNIVVIKSFEELVAA